MIVNPSKLPIGEELSETLCNAEGKVLAEAGDRITRELVQELSKVGLIISVADDEDGDPAAAEEELGLASRAKASSPPKADEVPKKQSSSMCKPLDKELLDRLNVQFEVAKESVNDLARDFVSGKLRDNVQVEQLAGGYVDALMKGTDEVIVSAQSQQGKRQLVDRCVQMGVLAMSVGTRVGLDGEQLQNLGLAGFMHDWSMFMMNESARSLTDEMSAADRIEFFRHSRVSFDLLGGLGVHPSVADAVLHAHERLDGSGFPDGLMGSEIELYPRILAVVDCYLELTQPMGDRVKIVPCDAVAYLVGQVGKRKLCPYILRAFLEIMSQYPIGSLLQLSDGRQVRVLRCNGKKFGYPIVQLLEDGSIIDMADETAEIERPLLRTNENEYRLKQQFREVYGGQELPETLSHECIDESYSYSVNIPASLPAMTS